MDPYFWPSDWLGEKYGPHPICIWNSCFGDSFISVHLCLWVLLPLCFKKSTHHKNLKPIFKKYLKIIPTFILFFTSKCTKMKQKIAKQGKTEKTEFLLMNAVGSSVCWSIYTTLESIKFEVNFFPMKFKKLQKKYFQSFL